MRVRIGIDVGGTFTKGVAVNNDTYDIIGKASVLTTHYAPEGVAKGVIDVFNKLFEGLGIDPEEVVFLAHSTTQATNALLEGDVVPVGVIGMGTGFDGFRAKSLTKLKKIELAPGRFIQTDHRFINTSKISKEAIKRTIQNFIPNGVKVIVASEAFGVDNPKNELLVMKISQELGIPATGGHEISKLYGLEVRTRTAVINACILPKLIETANMTEHSIRTAGIKAPLMIMRGDGGTMDINEMRKRPILTMLSGPSASVAGALMYLRVSNGIFFEVGGTSTNIGVIRNGMPAIKYVILGGHKTYLHSLDVRVLGVAGGSMVRVRDKEIFDVGPRSAHIAGLRYSAFAKTEEITDPRVVLIQPRPKDPRDYVSVKTASGEIFAITNTCAANALGITKEGDFAHGNPEAARKAFEPLAKELGLTIEETAQKVLEISSAKIIKVIEELITEYELEREQVVLVGGGGGAAALIPFTSKVSGLDYKISENAEVISSIGAALAMVRDVIERTIFEPKPMDILRVRREAEEAAIKAGAAPDTVEVYIEINPQLHTVRAIALGSTELRTRDLLKKEISLDESRVIAAESMRVPSKDVNLAASTKFFDVFDAVKIERKGLFGVLKSKAHPITVLDKEGVIRLSIRNGAVLQSSVQNAIIDLKANIPKYTYVGEMGTILPQVYVVSSKPRILDLSGLMKDDQIIALVEPEIKFLKAEEHLVFVIGKFS